MFRNEGVLLSSMLILEAEGLALSEWPGQKRYYSYINPDKIKSANPGFCFKQAGWRNVRDVGGRPSKTGSGLLILEKMVAR